MTAAATDLIDPIEEGRYARRALVPARENPYVVLKDLPLSEDVWQARQAGWQDGWEAANRELASRAAPHIGALEPKVEIDSEGIIRFETQPGTEVRVRDLGLRAWLMITPEEATVFGFLGWEWLDPAERR